ncbi:MAG: hypothetical protein KGZ79_16670 [Dethiobacter sp.]|jgi:hypothetical protein|nr:hypothetical protein [Dethiobacter sp.]
MSIPSEKIPDFKLDKILEQYMVDQLTKKKFNYRELRISENGSCGRKRVLRALGRKETHALTLEDARNFEKGRMGEGWIAKVLDELYPGEIHQEVIVKHPYGEPHGEGHADLVWTSKGIVYEVKTVSEEKAAHGLPITGHVNQNMSYQHFLNKEGHKIRAGEIIYLILARYGVFPVSFPVYYVSEIGDALEEEMRNLWVNHVLRKDVPFVPEDAHPRGFPCYWEGVNLNGEKVPHFCQYHGHCWDLEESFIDEICTNLDDDENIKLFDEYERIKSTMKALENEQKKLKEKKGVLEARLARLYNKIREKKLQAGAVVISRAQLSGRVTYDTRKAIECGVISPQALEPFKSFSPGYYRFTVKRVKAS